MARYEELEVIPAKARKEARIGEGDVVSVQIQGDGRLLLVRLEIPKSAQPEKARLIQRKGTHPVIKGGRQPTEQELKEALAELAARRRMKLATLDTGIAHAAVEVIR